MSKSDFSTETKEEAKERSKGKCEHCGRAGSDYDHGVKRSKYPPKVNGSWNCNFVCRKCLIEITNPDTAYKWKKYIKGIQKALNRACIELEREDIKEVYAIFKDVVKRYDQLYEDNYWKHFEKLYKDEYWQEISS